MAVEMHVRQQDQGFLAARGEVAVARSQYFRSMGGSSLLPTPRRSGTCSNAGM
jgi:hypothetical protein